MKNTIILFSIISLFACENNTNKTVNTKPLIVCTTGMIGNAVENIVGDKYEVITLMGPGVDPHLYKATQGDLKSLNRANIIIYNGLHLEGKMGEIFEKLSNRKHIIVASNAIPIERLINNTDFQGAHDPHLWFDVQLWSDVIMHLSNEITAFNPDLKQELFDNTLPYYESLLTLDKSVRNKVAELDSNKRILITAHDAFGYFGKAYGFEVRGLQGISTVSEYGLKDVSNLVRFISERKIKAVFVESSVSDRSLKAVIEGCNAKGHNVKIGGTLFSDAMGEDKTTEGTYIGMVNYNINTIISSLK
jgi:manganese/zinc/iron transport system substrate-binding protein